MCRLGFGNSYNAFIQCNGNSNGGSSAVSYQELAMGVNSRQFNQELKKREKEDLHDLLTPKKKKKKRSSL